VLGQRSGSDGRDHATVNQQIYPRDESAAGLSRNSVAAAMSSGVPIRRTPEPLTMARMVSPDDPASFT